MKIKIAALKEGQEVGLANCTQPGRVLYRLDKNLYRVQWMNVHITMPRNQLLVKDASGNFVRF